MQRVCFQLQVRPDRIDDYTAQMAEFFEDLGDARPDTGFLQLHEVFHLEDQLTAAPTQKSDQEE